MATANNIILDKSVGHQIDTIGYSNYVVGKIISLLNKVDADLMAKVVVAIENLPASQFTVDRLEQLLVSVRALNSSTYDAVNRELDTQLREFTQYELEFEATLLNSVQPKPVFMVSADTVYAAAMARPFQGKLLREWMAGLEDGKATLIRDAIRIGFVEGQTTSEIVKRIRGTRSLKYADGLLEITRRNAESIVLTAVSHTANYARQSLYQANDDIVKAERYTATLDTRTTLLCSSRDGNTYAIGTPKPAIPAHIRCRSIYIAVLKSFREMGLDFDELPASTRSSIDGQVADSLNYQEWLTKQSVARQNEVLGVTKGELFRKGDLSLDRFVSRQGHQYTLTELRIRDSAVFAKAGL